MLGWSPDVLSAANWVLASVLAGLGGILVGPITALDPATTTLLVVPALAAALAGRLASFGTTVAAALALGMAQSAMLKLQDDFSWIPRAGVREALPLVVILVALALGAGRTLGRGAPGRATLCRWPPGPGDPAGGPPSDWPGAPPACSSWAASTAWAWSTASSGPSSACRWWC